MSEMAVYRPSTDTWVDVIGQVVKLAEHVADTDFVPKGLRGNPPAIAAAILHGRELGLSPMTALSQTHMVEGKPTVSAEAQRGLVLAAGHEIEFVELTDATVTVRGRRAGADRWESVTWTADRARRAGLAGKNTYRAYPRAMLAARASAELCRLMFADVLHGMMATEELDGQEPENTPQEPRKRTVTRAPAPPPPAIPPAPVDRGAAIGAEPEPSPDVPDPAPSMSTQPPPDDTPPPPAPPTPVTAAQLKMLGAVWRKFHADDEERRRFTETLVGRDLGGTTRNLTLEEASGVLAVLTRILSENEDDPDASRMDLAHAMEGVGEFWRERDE